MHRENISNYGAGSNMTDLIIVTKIGIRINRKYFHSTLCMPDTSHVLTPLLNGYDHDPILPMRKPRPREVK